jgi:hypothetical protein
MLRTAEHISADLVSGSGAMRRAGDWCIRQHHVHIQNMQTFNRLQVSLFHWCVNVLRGTPNRTPTRATKEMTMKYRSERNAEQFPHAPHAVEGAAWPTQKLHPTPILSEIAAHMRRMCWFNTTPVLRSVSMAPHFICS